MPLALLLSLATAASAPGPGHPCLSRGDTARVVAPVPGQPAAVAVITAALDTRRRAWVGDTVAGRCLGYVAAVDTLPGRGAIRWYGYVPNPGFSLVRLTGAPDGGAATMPAALAALFGVLAGPAPSTVASAPAASGASANAPGVPATPAPSTSWVSSSAPTPPKGAPALAPLPRDAIGARYVDNFRKYADKLWQLEGSKWQGNYYDRALIYYQAWRRLGDPEYRRRADAIAVEYRQLYLEKNNYGASPHWAQLEGLVEHYRLTGDTMSRRAVIQTANRLSGAFIKSRYMEPSNGESRIAARVLHAQLLAWEVSPPDGKRMQAGRIDSALARIAAWQAPDGSYPAVGQVCGGQLNYMVGMLNDVLIKVYEQYRPDPRILPLVQHATDYLWRTQWVPAKQAFQYASVTCASNAKGLSVGGPRPAPDLNNLFTTSFGWLWRMTGDSRYREAGEQVFAGGVQGAYLDGTKQFNESYTVGWRYLDYR
ncbi:MAG: hypothetical protein JO180_09980 [Gemmatirosa sp.]|nr:hypothetical protein [Gemmatirosa sp.]